MNTNDQAPASLMEAIRAYFRRRNPPITEPAPDSLYAFLALPVPHQCAGVSCCPLRFRGSVSSGSH